MADPALPTTFDFVYADETYRIEVLDAEQLRWTRTVGADPGTTDIERYVASRLDDGRWLITWVEAPGLGLSSVLDLDADTLVTHANQGRDVFENPGTLRVIA